MKLLNSPTPFYMTSFGRLVLSFFLLFFIANAFWLFYELRYSSQVGHSPTVSQVMLKPVEVSPPHASDRPQTPNPIIHSTPASQVTLSSIPSKTCFSIEFIHPETIELVKKSLSGSSLKNQSWLVETLPPSRYEAGVSFSTPQEAFKAYQAFQKNGLHPLSVQGLFVSLVQAQTPETALQIASMLTLPQPMSLSFSTREIPAVPLKSLMVSPHTTKEIQFIQSFPARFSGTTVTPATCPS